MESSEIEENDPTQSPPLVINEENDEQEQLQTTEMSLQPCIMESTSSSTSNSIGTTGHQPLINVNDIKKETEDTEVIMTKETKGIKIKIEPELTNDNDIKPLVSSTSMIHFKKALIYSSTSMKDEPSDDDLSSSNTSNIVNFDSNGQVKMEIDDEIEEKIIVNQTNDANQPNTDHSESDDQDKKPDIKLILKDNNLTPPTSISSVSSMNTVRTNTVSFPAMPQFITHVGRKPLNGPPCSLKTLVDDKILEPMDGSLTYEIMGTKFLGDLLDNGFIRMSGTQQMFANPSSWANYCRSTIPSTSKDHKTHGSAWSIIRYLGKRLDSYKLRWYRKQKKKFMGNGGISGISKRNQTPNHSVNNDDIDITQGYSFRFSNVRVITPTPIFINGKVFLIDPPTTTSGNNQSLASNHLNKATADFKDLISMINNDSLVKLDVVSAGDPKINSENFPLDENLIDFNSIDISNKELKLNDHVKVRCVPFNSVYCFQPFLVTISTNVLLLIDFHSHLTSNEVIGYMAGKWDSRTQQLSITQAYPIQRERSTEEINACFNKIKKELVKKRLILVGWYHSHPKIVPHPTIQDIKNQLTYQRQMLEKGIQNYSPFVGLITSPFYKKEAAVEDDQSVPEVKLETLFQIFWVMPILTHGAKSIGRPMQISYSIIRDAFLTQDLLLEMRVLATYYSMDKNFTKFEDYFHGNTITYWDKLQESLKSKLPRDLVETQLQAVHNDIQRQALVHFWSFIKNLLHIS